MSHKKFGYGRVSAKDQNEARQLEALLAAGIEERDTFIDKQTGKNFQRPQYQLLKQMLRAGDVLYVHSLDRFGRNKDQILKEWQDITKNIGADIVVMDMPLLDTTQHRDSLGSFISDLVLQILSWVAEEERERIKKRQREGIDAARKAGKNLGRKPISIPEEFPIVYEDWKSGKMTAVAAMQSLGMTKTSFYKYVKVLEGREKTAAEGQ